MLNGSECLEGGAGLDPFPGCQVVKLHFWSFSEHEMITWWKHIWRCLRILRRRRRRRKQRAQGRPLGGGAPAGGGAAPDGGRDSTGGGGGASACTRVYVCNELVS